MKGWRTDWRGVLRRRLEPLRRVRRHMEQVYAGRLCVDLHTRWLGFFAQMAWVLEILSHAEESGRRAQIRLTGPQYVTPSRGPDFLGYFYEPLEPDLPLKDDFWHRIDHINQLRLPRQYDGYLTIESANALLFRHFQFRAEVIAEFDTIARELLGDAPALGVHFRGTDKNTEADLVPPARMLTALEVELARMPTGAPLFVATDEQVFLEACVSRFGRRVVALPDHRRSTNDRPVHRDLDGDGYALARDALFNCLMLSRCRRVLKTASVLSAWAKVFEPSLEIYTLSRRRGPERKYFPERCIPDYMPGRVAVVA